MNPFIRTSVRAMLNCTSREKALRRADDYRAQYASLAARLTPDSGRRPVKVPPMQGVDEDSLVDDSGVRLHHPVGRVQDSLHDGLHVTGVVDDACHHL